MENTSKNSVELLNRWLKRLRESQFSHYEAAKAFSRYNYAFGIPAAVLSTIVGTSVFASLGKSVDPSLQIIVGVISVMSAVFAGLQTFFRFSETAEKHRSVAARYGSIRRRIEEILAVNGGDIPKDQISAIRSEIDSLAEEAPNISPKIWHQAVAAMKE